MRFSTLTIIVATASVALAVPAPFKRGINCPSADKDGTALTASTSLVEDGNQFAECTYADAGACTYFFADGSFSSGSSTCPKGLPQNDASNTPIAGGSTGSTGTASAGAIDSSIVCPSSDKDGTPLTASSSFKDDDGNEFAQCTYKDAGPCAFFFADGSFSSGSSTCPKGLPQTGGAVPPPVTTTQAPPPVTTKQAPPPVTTTQAPPPVTTTQAPPPVTTTQAPPPPATTSTTPVLITSTSTFFSTVQPSTSLSAAPAPPATTSIPIAAVPPPAQSSTTTVVVQTTSTPAPTGGGTVANSGLGDGSTNGAVGQGGLARGVGTLLPILLVVGVLL